MKFTRDDLEKFNSATYCHVCEKLFAPDEYAIIVIWPGDSKVPHIQIVI